MLFEHEHSYLIISVINGGVDDEKKIDASHTGMIQSDLVLTLICDLCDGIVDYTTSENALNTYGVSHYIVQP